jgi:uncharacterized protein (TIGR03382 family)
MLAFAGGALVLGIIAACAAPQADEAQGGSGAAISEKRTFDRNNVLDDTSMRDAMSMTAADVQKFLETTPWGTRSVLASYTENGNSAAQIMVDIAQANGINPLEMLVRVEMEQSLVSKTSAPASTIALAFGCGCPHSPLCSDKYRGFVNQADCAAGTLRRSMDRAVTPAGTVSGWARNKAKDTEDKLSVTPANAVTAALYTYTPWVGEAGGGKAKIGGVSLHWGVWNSFAEKLGYGEWALPATAEPAPTTPDPTPVPDPAPTPTTDSDAGLERPDGSGSGSGSGSGGAPEDGSEDSKLLAGGNAPAAAIEPPHSTTARPSELTTATEAELTSKPKTTGGCSTSGHGSPMDGGAMVGGAIAFSLLVSRRRRASH